MVGLQKRKYLLTIYYIIEIWLHLYTAFELPQHNESACLLRTYYIMTQLLSSHVVTVERTEVFQWIGCPSSCRSREFQAEMALRITNMSRVTLVFIMNFPDLAITLRFLRVLLFSLDSLYQWLSGEGILKYSTNLFYDGYNFHKIKRQKIFKTPNMLNVFVSLYSAVASIGTEEAEAKKKIIITNIYWYKVQRILFYSVMDKVDTISLLVWFYNNTNTKTKVWFNTS